MSKLIYNESENKYIQEIHKLVNKKSDLKIIFKFSLKINNEIAYKQQKHLIISKTLNILKELGIEIHF